MAVVSDANLVTIAIDSSFLGVQNLLLIIIIFVDCYCYYLIQSALIVLLMLFLMIKFALNKINLT